jgi:antitoxin component of RelBE/YafQ-DinJ toxin-antitoxin module
MSKTVIMNIRLDEDTRRELKDFANEVGIPAASLVNATIKQMLRTREVTFSSALEPTPYLERVMREAEAELAAGDVDTFETKEEALEHLRSLARHDG